MQLSPNVSVSAHPELVEGPSVKEEAPTMIHITAISPPFPAIQLQPMTSKPTQYPPKFHPNPYLHDRK